MAVNTTEENSMRHSPFYDCYMSSPAWRAKCRLVKQRARNGMCEFCGSNKGEQVHHFHYRNLGHEPLSDLIFVCARCHKFLDEQREERDFELYNHWKCKQRKREQIDTRDIVLLPTTRRRTLPARPPDVEVTITLVPLSQRIRRKFLKG